MFSRTNKMIDRIPASATAQNKRNFRLAMEISAFFCKETSTPGVGNMKFNFSYHHGMARVILKGTEDFVSAVMKKYYQG